MFSPILSVTDVEASIAFYTQRLGFAHAWSMPPGDDGKTTFACVQLGQAEILLGTIDFVEPADRAKRGIGIQLYIEAPADHAIDAVYQQAVKNGVNITRPIENRDWGVRAFNFNDPDGYQYMIAQPLPRS